MQKVFIIELIVKVRKIMKDIFREREGD